MAERTGRLRVYLAPGLVATLELEPAARDRVPAALPALTGRQLTGAACVVCGSPLGMNTTRIGTVRQTLPGGRDLVYPVRACTDRCRPRGG
ncbi:hypothetical protein [Streptomyces sp. B6B3]|uniref:hypothetical protein n=1 Tax=Streptomyces sp. B6B3 TaxID=3153570 RepID=UPI00325D9340